MDDIILEDGKAVGVRACKATTWESAKNDGEKPPMVEIRAKVCKGFSSIFLDCVLFNSFPCTCITFSAVLLDLTFHIIL